MVIRLDRVTYRYEAGRGRSSPPVLTDLSQTIEGGHFVVICGPPGSGKSTLLQLLNGILIPSEGSVRVFDYHIQAGQKLRRSNELRRRVGLVFQFPERQFFAPTVREDMIFGPLNFGMTREEAERIVTDVCRKLGIRPSLLDVSPHSLSGGQLRKAAIGAVLAARPDILVLDEPTCSLDSAGRDELLQAFRRMCDEDGMTVILVTHRLEEVLPYADEYVVLNEGKIVFSGDAVQLAARAEELETLGFAVPAVIRLLISFSARHGADLPIEALGRRMFDAGVIAQYIDDVMRGRDRRDEDDDAARPLCRYGLAGAPA